MHLNGNTFTVALDGRNDPAGKGTRIVYTEQVAYLDGNKWTGRGNCSRERGVTVHLDGLENSGQSHDEIPPRRVYRTRR